MSVCTAHDAPHVAGGAVHVIVNRMVVAVRRHARVAIVATRIDGAVFEHRTALLTVAVHVLRRAAAHTVTAAHGVVSICVIRRRPTLRNLEAVAAAADAAQRGIDLSAQFRWRRVVAALAAVRAHRLIGAVALLTRQIAVGYASSLS